MRGARALVSRAPRAVCSRRTDLRPLGLHASRNPFNLTPTEGGRLEPRFAGGAGSFGSLRKEDLPLMTASARELIGFPDSELTW